MSLIQAPAFSVYLLLPTVYLAHLSITPTFVELVNQILIFQMDNASVALHLLLIAKVALMELYVVYAMMVFTNCW